MIGSTDLSADDVIAGQARLVRARAVRGDSLRGRAPHSLSVGSQLTARLPAFPIVMQERSRRSLLRRPAFLLVDAAGATRSCEGSRALHGWRSPSYSVWGRMPVPPPRQGRDDQDARSRGAAGSASPVTAFEGLACSRLTSTAAASASVNDRVLKNRAAQSHLSMLRDRSPFRILAPLKAVTERTRKSIDRRGRGKALTAGDGEERKNPQEKQTGMVFLCVPLRPLNQISAREVA